MNYPTIKSIVLTIFTLFCITSISFGSVLTPALMDAAEFGNADSLITVVVILDTYTQSEDLQLQAPSNSTYNRADNIKKVISKLSSYKAPHQNSIEFFLKNSSKQPIIKHWIIPAYTAELTVADIKVLSELSDRKSVV